MPKPISQEDREFHSLVARSNMATRWGNDNATELKLEVAEAKITRAIEKAVATAPPLRAEQVDRLSAILHVHA